MTGSQQHKQSSSGGGSGGGSGSGAGGGQAQVGLAVGGFSLLSVSLGTKQLVPVASLLLMSFIGWTRCPGTCFVVPVPSLRSVKEAWCRLLHTTSVFSCMSWSQISLCSLVTGRNSQRTSAGALS